MDDLGNLGLVDDGDIVLDEAALTLALLDHEETDVAPYEDVLSDIASRLDEVGAGVADASERATCLAQVLAEEFGFSGDVAAARASLTAMLEITREPALRERITSTLEALAAG